MDMIQAGSVIDLTDYTILPIPAYKISINDYTVYGKGIDCLLARVSVMMEAIERYSARHLPSNTLLAKYGEVQQISQIIDLKTIIGSEISIPNSALMEWLPGTDLVSNAAMWVPAYYALLKPSLSGPRLLKRRTSNGLASGNTFDEAVCHALFELIERDAWTLCWLQTVTLPQTKYMAQRIQLSGDIRWDSAGFTIQADGFPLIDINSLPEVPRDLISRFESAGMVVRIRNITSDIGIATFIVGCHDGNDGYYGIGTHLSSTVAITRAITECAQVYHIKKHVDMNHMEENNHIDKLKYKLMFSESKSISFDEVMSYERNNLHDDLRVIVSNLVRVGINQIVVLDLTHQDLRIPVVRVITPGLEDWGVHNFSPEYSSLGQRGKSLQYIDDTKHQIF